MMIENVISRQSFNTLVHRSVFVCHDVWSHRRVFLCDFIYLWNCDVSNYNTVRALCDAYCERCMTEMEYPNPIRVPSELNLFNYLVWLCEAPRMWVWCSCIQQENQKQITNSEAYFLCAVCGITINIIITLLWPRWVVPVRVKIHNRTFLARTNQNKPIFLPYLFSIRSNANNNKNNSRNSLYFIICVPFDFFSSYCCSAHSLRSS